MRMRAGVFVCVAVIQISLASSARHLFARYRMSSSYLLGELPQFALHHHLDQLLKRYPWLPPKRALRLRCVTNQAVYLGGPEERLVDLDVVFPIVDPNVGERRGDEITYA